jgi:hypothetical protein
MLPDYNSYISDESFLFPGWPENHLNVSKMKKWSVRQFFRRTMGLITTSNNLRALLEMNAAKLLQENKIDGNIR